MVVFGTPDGHPDFVEQWLGRKLDEQQELLDRIPAVQDTQCAWLLLLLCAGPRAAHILRNLPPTQSQQYARAHDAAMLRCLSRAIGGERCKMDMRICLLRTDKLTFKHFFLIFCLNIYVRTFVLLR